MTPEDVLEKAAEVISEHGHLKGAYGGEKAGFCAMGAMRHAITGDALRFFGSEAVTENPALADVYKEARRLLAQRLAPDVDPDYSCEAIAEWNDSRHTTAEDVVLALKTAAAHD